MSALIRSLLPRRNLSWVTMLLTLGVYDKSYRLNGLFQKILRNVIFFLSFPLFIYLFGRIFFFVCVVLTVLEFAP